MSLNHFPRPAGQVVLFLAVAQFALQASLLARGVAYITSSLTIDDTYYYLQSAWNWRHLGFVTFDGLHATNGVQLLWFVIILGLALVTNSKAALLIAVLILSFAFNALCHLFIWQVGVAVRRPALALLMAGLWVLQVLPFRLYSMGMENSLHALVFWCAVWQCLVFLERVRTGARPNVWALTLVLILNAWTRLDSALLSACLYVLCVGTLAYGQRRHLRAFWRTHWRGLAGSSLAAGAGLVIQLGAFQLMGGSILPVSALVKTSSASRGLGAAALDKFVEVLVLGLPPVVQGRFPTPVLVLLAGAGSLLACWACSAFRGRANARSSLARLWLGLFIAEVLYHGYVAVSGVTYLPYFAWYRSPSFIFWIITAALAVQFGLEHLPGVERRLPALPWAPAGVSLLLFAGAGYLFLRSIGFTSGLYAARYEAALWISANSAPETTFAAWNTGQLGYFSDRTFINLDGVINHVDYFERVLQGSVPLAQYLHENGVAYVVDYATYAPLPAYPVVRSFPINDGTGRSIQFWQVTSATVAGP